MNSSKIVQDGMYAESNRTAAHIAKAKVTVAEIAKASKTYGEFQSEVYKQLKNKVARNYLDKLIQNCVEADVLV